MVEQTLGLELAAHRHVVVEPARGEHDSAPCGHGHLPAVLLEDGTGDAVAVGDQTHERGLGPDRHTGLQHTREQSRSDRLTTGDVFPLDGEPGDALRQSLEDAREALVRHAQHEVHPLVVGARRGHGQPRLHQARAQPSAFLTEHRQVERLAFTTASDRRATGQLGVVIGIALRPEELHRRRAPEHVDRRHTVVDEGLAALGRCRAVHHGPDVGVAALEGVPRPRLGQNRIGRNPERTAGAGRRSTDMTASSPRSTPTSRVRSRRGQLPCRYPTRSRAGRPRCHGRGSRAERESSPSKCSFIRGRDDSDRQHTVGPRRR